MKNLVVAASTGILFASGAIRSQRLDPQHWERQLRLLKNQGFSTVDLSELWLPLTDLTDQDVQRLGSAVAEAELDIAGLSIIDVNLSDMSRREAGSQKVLRALEVTRMLGARFLSIGFHGVPTDGKLPDQWGPGNKDEIFEIGDELSRLAKSASSLGIELSLEMYERGILDRSANVLAILDATQSDAIGANPDLGNLLRAPWPLIESVEQTLQALAPRINYWHVKNAMRIPLLDGTSTHHATAMHQGSIDYRSALQIAVRQGFRGPLLIEHYGGDSISYAAAGRRYLESLVEEILTYEEIPHLSKETYH